MLTYFKYLTVYKIRNYWRGNDSHRLFSSPRTHHPNDFRDIHENQIDNEIFETDDDNFEYSLKILRLLAYITGEKDMYYFSLY